MDAKLERFLKQIALEDIYIDKLKDAKIVSVVYKKSQQRFLIKINNDNILDPNIINNMEHKIKEKGLNYDLYFEVNESKSINNLAINSYYLAVIIKKFKGAPAFDGLKKIKLVLNNNIIKINCTQSQKYILDDVKKELSNYFNKVGINYVIDIEASEVNVEKTIEALNEAQDRIIQKELEKARQIANEQVNNVPEKIEPIKRSKFTYDEVKICELRADDQNVSISGRVFKIEETPIRSGKSIVVY